MLCCQNFENLFEFKWQTKLSREQKPFESANKEDKKLDSFEFLVNIPEGQEKLDIWLIPTERSLPIT